MANKMTTTGVVVAVLMAATASASPSHTPAPGSPERKAILDALRKPVQRDMKQDVVFHEVHMKVKDGWAYVIAQGRDAAGHPLRYFAPEIDPSFQALLRDTKTGWRVLDWGAGTGMDATDHAHKLYPRSPVAIWPVDPYAAENAALTRRTPMGGHKPVAPSGWRLVRTFSGGPDTSDSNTETFMVGSRWKIEWTTEAGEQGGQGTLEVFVRPAPDANIGDAIGHAISHKGGGSGAALERVRHFGWLASVLSVCPLASLIPVMSPMTNGPSSPLT